MAGTNGDKGPGLRFRREALEDQETLERYDSPTRLVRPRAWILLFAIVILISGAVLWSLLGRVQVTVQGQGILLRGGPVGRVVSVNAGQLKSLTVDIGDNVKVGQKIGSVYAAQLDAAVHAAEEQTRALRAEYERVKGSPGAGAAEVAGLKQQWQSAQAALDAAKADLEDGSAIVSRWEGVVASVQAYPGHYLQAGAPVVTLEAYKSAPLIAMLFFDPADGKKVGTGMDAQVLPSTFNVEEYGYMAGQVYLVGEMPATPESLMAELQNELLVQQYSAGGSPIRIVILLDKSYDTPSGYAWSSSDGPPQAPSSQTECVGRVVVEEKAPITFVFPALSKYLGGE